METKTQEDYSQIVSGAWELSTYFLFIYKCLDGWMDGQMNEN